MSWSYGFFGKAMDGHVGYRGDGDEMSASMRVHKLRTCDFLIGNLARLLKGGVRNPPCSQSPEFRNLKLHHSMFTYDID